MLTQQQLEEIRARVENATHPVQPTIMIDGAQRFKQNAIVRFLLDAGPFDLNNLAIMPFSREDRDQFAQLIGYSVWGAHELDYVSDETLEQAKNPDIPALLEALEAARAEIETDNRLIAELERLLHAIPECPIHGRCIPHAIEYVEGLEAENARLHAIIAQCARGEDGDILTCRASDYQTCWLCDHVEVSSDSASKD